MVHFPMVQVHIMHNVIILFYFVKFICIVLLLISFLLFIYLYFFVLPHKCRMDILDNSIR